MPAFEVLPTALVAAAGDLREVGRAVTGLVVPPLASGSAALDGAMDDLTRACTGAGRSLEERSAAAARAMQEFAEQLGQLERLLTGGAVR